MLYPSLVGGTCTTSPGSDFPFSIFSSSIALDLMSIVDNLEEVTKNSIQVHIVRQRISMARDKGLSESYHLHTGLDFGMWAYHMKNMLQKDKISLLPYTSEHAHE